MTPFQRNIIEGAFLAGFEPSNEDITIKSLFEEANNFLTNHLLNT